jgi:hypothetical protein
MSGSKPALGYASRTEAVLAMCSEGLSRRDIAVRLGVEPKTVSALESSAKRWRGRYARRPEGSDLPVIPLHVRILLRPHAAKRDMTVDALMRAIVEAVATHGIVDAVLDDGDR